MNDAPSIRRGRLFIRRTGPTSANGAGWSEKPKGSTYAMVGHVEIDDDSHIRREVLHDFAGLFTGSSATLSFEGDMRPIEPHMASSDLGSCATGLEYRIPGEVHRAMGWGGGSVLLRDTRAPSSPGTTSAAIMIVLTGPHDGLPDAHMASFELLPDRNGRPVRGRIDVEGPCPIRTNGKALSQVHKEALWGWGDEPFGFRSTMRLDMVDLCTRYDELRYGPDADADANQDELERISRLVDGAVGTTHREPEYGLYRKLLLEEMPQTPWDACPTASEQLRLSEASERIVRRILHKAA